MSRRNDAGASYDRTLLSNIPTQHGQKNSCVNPPDGQLGATDGYSPGANGSRITKKAPWYRTRWGITTIVIIIILIIGGVVGGAVGGTQHSSSHNSTEYGSNVVGPAALQARLEGASEAHPGLTSTTIARNPTSSHDPRRNPTPASSSTTRTQAPFGMLFYKAMFGFTLAPSVFSVSTGHVCNLTMIPGPTVPVLKKQNSR
ncbi:hypothetical protein BJV77DRAFT_1037740 [Russula vinacea]|nr:hypothetical protein BJV77DRAFT_1037740 [Russula vinacea]